jgi:predicted membrane-bound spermidine synthase
MKARKAITLLSFVFFFSGAAALMYQVAWQRLLTVYYGVGSISIALIVSVYMFGLGFGALIGGYIAEHIKILKNKILFYFFIEILIGCFGLISPVFLDFLGRHTAGSSYKLSFFYMVIFLSVPTLLMGTTLPLLTKIFNRLVHNFLKSVSFLYFINTIGAALGALIAGYIIISFWGLDTAVYIAAIVNFLLGGLIFFTKFLLGEEKSEKVEYSTMAQEESIIGVFAYPLVFITGFLAIGYEIIWFRVMGVLLKSSPYMFSSVLSVYLIGIAVGSLYMNKFLERKKNVDKKSLFFTLQFLIGVYVLVSFIGYFYLTRDTFFVSLSKLSFSVNIHPLLKIPSIDSIGDLTRDIYPMLDVFFWPIIFVLVPTILMGASFPLISLLALSHQDKEGKTVGTVYFFNIIGNVLGAVITGFILLPYFGTERILLFFASIGILFGLFMRRTSGIEVNFLTRFSLVFIILITGILFFPGRGKLYEVMHNTVEQSIGYLPHLKEGKEGVVITYAHDEKIRLYINGHLEGIRPMPVAYYWSMEALSHAKKYNKVLIIGFGGGTIAEAILNTEGVSEVVVVELNGSLIENLSEFPAIKKIFSDKKLKLIIDDGRRYLLRTDEKYDIVIMEAARTYMAYSNNLFSKEFFYLIKDHLNEGGIFLLREPLGTGMLKTVLSVFDYVKRYWEFSLISDSPLEKNVKQRDILLENIISDKMRTRVRDILKKRTSREISKDDLSREEFSYYSINTDWKPMSEYYIGVKTRGLLFIPPRIRERFKTPYGF